MQVFGMKGAFYSEIAADLPPVYKDYPCRPVKN
jgi:hypothetical protein